MEAYIVGSDFNPLHLEWCELDAKYSTPRHNDARFLDAVKKIIAKENAEFIHPQPEAEAYVIALAKARNELDSVGTLLPNPQAFEKGIDKAKTAEACLQGKVPAPKTMKIRGEEEVLAAFEEIRTTPIWVRARAGAGGRLSFSCKSPEEATQWCRFWVTAGKASWTDFLFQEYLPGRNIAWDSVWKDGKLIASFARERVEYIFPHVAPSGVTGTPTVAVTIVDKRVNEIAEEAVTAVDPKPNGFYCVDLKEDSQGVPRVTEVNVGKLHTTGALWGYALVKCLGLPLTRSLVALYLKLAFDEEVENVPKYDLYPEGLYLLRHIDCGVWLLRKEGWKVKVL